MKEYKNILVIIILVAFITIVLPFSSVAEEKKSMMINHGDIYREKCAVCHSLDKVEKAKKSFNGWQKTVDRMVKMDPSLINQKEAEMIASYLGSKALFKEKCDKCHSSGRVAGKVKTKEQWTTTVNRMRNKDTSWISEEEASNIVNFLVEEYGL